MIEDADLTYRTTLSNLPQTLEEAYRNLIQTGPMSCDGDSISRAILLRVQAYFAAHQQMMRFLGKRYAAAAADFFEETMLFYLKAFIETNHLDLRVESEHSLDMKRGALRPDISIWRDEELMGAIECKTQLGWNRDNWAEDFCARRDAFHKAYPAAVVSLVILTSKNGPSLTDLRLIPGRDVLALTSVWPTDINPTRVSEFVRDRIDALFGEYSRL